MAGQQQRKIVGPLVQFHLTLFHQMNAQWADESGRVAFAFRDVAGQLRHVHRFGGGEVAILAPVVNGRPCQQRENRQDPADDAHPLAHFQSVNPFL